jgi:copper(I)-binding protein
METIVKYFFSLTAAAILMVAAATTISSAHEIKAGNLIIKNMWSRATPGGAKVAGGYLTVENKGTVPDRLLSASSPTSGKVQAHEMAMTDGVMTMRPLESGLTIPPGASVSLAPGGLHLMLTELKQPLKEGKMLPIVLQFEKAGTVEVTLHIRGVGAQAPGGAAQPDKGHSGMKM